MQSEDLSIYEVGSMLDSEDLAELENELICGKFENRAAQCRVA